MKKKLFFLWIFGNPVTISYPQKHFLHLLGVLGCLLKLNSGAELASNVHFLHGL